MKRKRVDPSLFGNNGRVVSHPEISGSPVDVGKMRAI
jgi:hypothetical protein